MNGGVVDYVHRPIPSVGTFGRMLPFVASSPPGLPNLHSYSRRNNVIILLVDMLQSDLAEEMIEANEDIKNSLAGFTFFRNSAGVFPYTGLSLPAILSGRVYQAGESLDSYFASADLKRFDRKLSEVGFDVSYLGIWSRTLYAFGESAARRVDFERFRAILLHMQLPMTLKALYFNQLPDFLGNTTDTMLETASTDVTLLRRMARSIDLSAQHPQFKYIHLWGAHQPSVLDRSCVVQVPAVHRRRYLDQAYCLFALIGQYLQALKQMGAYDASQIFILADHGTTNFAIGGNIGGQDAVPLRVQSSAHPTILFKNRRETGDLRFSDSPVSLLDIGATILNGEIATASHDLSSPTGGPRARDFYFYPAAADAFGTAINNLEHYKIGPNVRELQGWKKE
jgi:hypothetical protein